MKPLGIAVILLLSSLFIVACSSTQLSYRFLNNFVRWQINDYVSLHSDQSRFINQQLAELHAWHRRDQLPVYVDFIDKQLLAVQQNQISMVYLNQMQQEAMGMWRTSTQALLFTLLDLFEMLDSGQISEVVDSILEKDITHQRKHINISTRRWQNMQRQRTQKRLAEWVGELEPQQQRLLEQWIRSLHHEPAIRSQQRHLYIERMTTLLNQHETRSTAALKNELSQLVLYPERYWTTSYRQLYEHNRQLTLKFIVDIYQSLSMSQQRHLSAEMMKYRNDFANLSRQ